MPPEIPFDQLSILWDDGERRLRAAEPRLRRQMEVIVDAVVQELRRRLGGAFETWELGALYLEGTDWCFDLATRVMPGTPDAWDMPTVVGAAFARYLHRAKDYGGGRRRLGDDGDDNRA